MTKSIRIYPSESTKAAAFSPHNEGIFWAELDQCSHKPTGRIANEDPELSEVKGQIQTLRSKHNRNNEDIGNLRNLVNSGHQSRLLEQIAVLLKDYGAGCRRRDIANNKLPASTNKLEQAKRQRDLSTRNVEADNQLFKDVSIVVNQASDLGYQKKILYILGPVQRRLQLPIPFDPAPAG